MQKRLLIEPYEFSSLAKRTTPMIILVITFYIDFKKECANSCQNREGTHVENDLPNSIATKPVVFANVTLTLPSGTSVGTITSLVIKEILYVSSIC